MTYNGTKHFNRDIVNSSMSITTNQSRVSKSQSDQQLARLLKDFAKLRQSEHSAVAANPTQNMPTVIVVGAGISGIKAAYELSLKGMHVVLLEAKDRIGGRVQTQVLNSNIVELGAQFLHGVKGGGLFSDMVKNKVNIQPMSREKFNIYDEFGESIDFDKLMPVIKKIKDKAAGLALQRLSDDVDRFVAKELETLKSEVKAAINLSEAQAQKLMQKVSTHELQRESFFEYKTGIGKTESESNYLICSGFGFYLERILDYAKRNGSLDLRLNTEVKKIIHETDFVSVTLASGEVVKGDALVCTLPLGVLQQGDVQFQPQLPLAKREAIQKLQMADHEKVIFLFNKVFWPNRSHFLIPYESHSQTWLDIVNLNYLSDSTNPVLVTSFHKKLESSDDEIMQELKNYLKKIFGKDFVEPIKSCITHWSDDPYAKGAYCYHPEAASLDDDSEIARPVGRLCFAGEHAYRGPASVKGAYESGKEAADQVIQQLANILQASTSK